MPTSKSFISYDMDFDLDRDLSQPPAPQPVTGLELTIYNKDSVKHVRHDRRYQLPSCSKF